MALFSTAAIRANSASSLTAASETAVRGNVLASIVEQSVVGWKSGRWSYVAARAIANVAAKPNTVSAMRFQDG